MKMKKVEINGINLAYEDRGSGDAVVLLHGFCGSSQYWKHVSPVLSENYRVIVPDLRGHGESDATESTYTMEMMADDIKLLLDKLSITKAILFGHSLGGYITLSFAEKYPQLLSGFSLIHSTARPDDTKGKENRITAIEEVKENGIQSFIEALIPKLFAPAHVESMPAVIEEVMQIGLQTKPAGVIHTLEGMKDRLDRNHVLRTSSVPVLLVAGEEDQLIPAEKTFSVEAIHITPVKLKSVGHMSMVEAPEDIIKVMKSFSEKINSTLN